MSLAELFFAKHPRRHFMQGNRRSARSTRKKMVLEPLEPRLLLDANPLTYSAAAGGALTLKLVEEAGVATLQLIDDNDLANILASQALSETSGVEIHGSDEDDRLTIDLSVPFALPVTFDAGGGADTLGIAGAGTASYTPTAGAAGAGTVAASGSTVAFTGVDVISIGELDGLTFVTAGSSDALTVDRPDAETTRVSGTSDGVDVTPITFSELGTLVIEMGEGDDILMLALDDLGGLDLTFDAGAGSDTLGGPSADSTWNITGVGAGDLGGVDFTGLENLSGAGDNADTVVFEAAGSLSGLLDGGPSGFDVIVLAGGYFQNVEYTISGPDSGTIARDGDVITYTGFEPIIDMTVGPTRTFNGSGLDEEIRIADRGDASDDDFVVSISPGEDVIFTDPDDITTLNINALGGADRIDLEAVVDLSGIDVFIDAGAGDDEIALELLAISQPSSLTLTGGADPHDAVLLRTTDAVTLTDTALDGVTLSGIDRAFIFGGTLDASLFTGQVFHTVTTPEWRQEGPNPYTQILDGATRPWDPVAGAINAIAVDPDDRFTIYLGTVNGGIWRNTGSAEVFFDLNQSTLTPDDQATLNAFAEFLEAHPGVTVEIGGHTDSSGDAGDNLTLSQARADSVRNYLVNVRHIEASRLRVVAYGEDRPVAENIGGLQPLNRRVELLVQNWEPLTDGFPSLSISSIAISPLSSQVIYAGVGRTSSFASAGGFETGLLFSNDGGDTWRVLGTERLKGLTISKVLPTTLTTPSGAQVVFVSTFDVDRDADGTLDDAGGVFRLEVAADGTAETIEKISGVGDVASGLPAGHYTDLAMDPGIAGDPLRPVRLYAGTPGSGIFQFTDGTDGLWHAVNTGFQFGTDADIDGADDLLQDASRIEFALHEATGALYAAVLGPVDGNGIFQLGGNRSGLIGLFKSEDFAAGWTSMPVPTSVDNGTTFGLHPGRQGDTHFSMVVDPTDEDIVYLGGDRQGATTNNSVGLNVSGGRLFAFDDLNGTWIQIVGNNADGTVPHADSRGMVFASDYTLLEIDDGGLSRLQNPFADADQGTRRWTSMNQGLFINEVLRLAYDPINNQILVGAQDNGSVHQGAGVTDGIDNDADGSTDEADEAAFWSGTGGDGNSQAAIPIDMTGDAIPDRVLRYSLHNNFTFLQLYEYTTAGVLIDANGNPSNTFRNIGLRQPGNATALSGLNAQDAALGFDVIPMVVNANDPTRMLIAYFGIYESINTNINPAAGQTRVLPLDEVQQIDPAAGVAVPAGNEVTALVYGGKIGGTRFDDLVIASRANKILVRQAVGQAFSERTVTGAGTIRDIVVDPSNWKVVYVADDTDVYRIDDVTDATKTWIKLTGNLKAVGQQDLRALEYVEAATGDLLLVGGMGGVSRLRDPGPAPGTERWVRLGIGLPNAPVFDLEYLDLNVPGSISGGDRLIAGTLGRGVWSIKGPDILAAGDTNVLEILGSTSADQFTLVRDTANPLLFNVFDLSQSATDPVFTARGSVFDQVHLNTRGGNDTVTVDHSGGAVSVPRGIAYDGGEPLSNTLVLTGGAFTSYQTGTTSGGLPFHEIVDLNNRTQLVIVENAATVDTSSLPSPLDDSFATVKGALEALVDFLTFADGLSKNIPLFGTSLGRALNGIDVEEPAPVSTPGAGALPQAELVVQASSETVNLLRRFIETGTGAFDIDDIAGFDDLADLVAALEGLDESGNGTVTPSGDLINGFEITLSGIRKTLTGRADVALELLGGAIDVDGLVDVSADVTLNLVFGVDNTHGFYIQSNPGVDIVVNNVKVEATDEVTAGGRFGFLGVGLTELVLTTASETRFDINIAETGGDGFIRLPELLGAPDDYVGVTLVAAPGAGVKDVQLTGTFEVSALLPGQPAPFTLVDARAVIAWDDITAPDVNDPSNVSVGAALNSPAGDALLSFLEVGTQDIIDRLTTFQTQLDGVFGTEVPFLSDGLTQLIGFVTAFQQKVIDPITGGIGGATGVPTIQSLVTTLANSLGVSPDSLGLAYDSASTELTYHLNVSHTILDESKQLGSGLNLAKGLADLEFSTDASVDASLGLDVIFGVDLGAVVSGADPLDWFFVKNPTATAAVDVTATDIEASARFGFLSIGVDEGTLSTPTPLGLVVSLNDTGSNAADGRIDLRELIDGLDELGTLVSANATGSVEMFLPVEAPFLGLPAIDGDPNTPPDPNYAITVTIPDINDLTTVNVVPGPGLSEVGNFANIDAASLVGLLGQLTFWLDEFRQSDEFADFDIPLVGPALDAVLGFADAFRDKLLLDDGDDGLDGAKTLLFDINAALEGAGLGDKVRAEASGGTIKLIANDAGIGSISVAAAPSLGFNGSETSSGSPFTSLTANAAPADVKLLADAVLNITIDGEATAVTILAADTNDNVALGNDRWKLVDPANAATFDTVDEMVLKLTEVLGTSSLAYEPADDTLTFTLNLAEVFGQVDLPVDFALPNLPSFLTLETGGVVRLMADGAFNLTLGVYLGDAPSSSQIDADTPLANLNGGIDISTDLRITGATEVRTVHGQLSGDANFSLSVNGGLAVEVRVHKAAGPGPFDPATAVNTTTDELTLSTSPAGHGLRTGDAVVYDNGGGSDIEGLVHGTTYFVVKVDAGKVKLAASFANAVASTPVVIDLTTTGSGTGHTLRHRHSTDDNATAADLAADINDALAAAGLDSQVQAVTDGLRIRLQEASPGALTALTLTASSSDPAVKDIGFAASQNGAIGPRTIVAATALAATDGKLTDDAHFELSIDGAPVDVTVTEAATSTNTTASHLVTDINAALAAAGLASQVVASFDGQRIRLQEVTPGDLTSLSLTAASGDPAVTQLGFGTAQTGATSPFGLSATRDLAALRGRLSADASFDVSLNTAGGGAPVTVNVLAAATATNRYAFDIVNDVQAAINATALNGHVTVGFSGDRLTFTAAGGATSFTITALAGNPAVTELGLATSNVGDSADFVIGVRDGSVYRITLDGLSTVGQVISEVFAQSSGKVTAAINSRGTGLTLTDNTFDDDPPGSGTFEVAIANNSTAAIQLGIVRADAQQGEAPDGAIEGSDIAGLTPLDRFFIQADPAVASVGLHLSTPTLDANGNVVDGDGDGDTGDDGLSGTAKFGFVGIDVSGGGTVGATLSLGLKDPGTVAADGRISLRELLDALDDLGTLLQAPALTTAPSSQILLDVDVDPALPGLTLGADPQIGIVVHSLGDPFATPATAPNIEFVYPDLGDLLAFQNPEFNFQNIVAALKALSEFLGQFEAFDFLSDPLPLIDVSVNDLIGIADKFAVAVTDAQSNPAGTVQFLEGKLEQAFGLPQGSPLIDLVLVDDDNGTPGDTSDDFLILKVEIEATAEFSRTLPLDFDLGLPFDLGGGADLSASGSLTLKLDFGFGLDPDDPLALPEIYVFDTTGLEGVLNLAATDLSFRAAYGPLGLFVNEGSADIHGTLIGGKVFRAGLQNATFTNDRILLGDLDLDTDFSAEIGGEVDIDLPVYFPTDSILAGIVRFDATLSYLGGEFDADASPKAYAPDGTTEISLADLFAFDPSELNLLDQLLLGVDGIDLFLEGLQDILDGEVAGVELPLIGDKLAGAADVIGDFRDGFIEDFRQAIEDLANPSAAFAAAGGGAGLLAAEPDPVSKILGELLGDSGLGLLIDANSDGKKDAFDIQYASNINEPGVAPENLFFDWDFKLGSTPVDKSAGIDFDIGIPGLGLETRGAVNLMLGWELDFGFGLNTTDGFYLDIEDGSELELTVDVTVPGGGITGTLGFLQLSADDQGQTHLGAKLGVNIKNENDTDLEQDAKLGFSEIGKISLDVSIAAEAIVDLGLRLSLSSDLVPNAPTNFPSVVADFTLEWGIGDFESGALESLSSLDGSFLKNGLRFVGFEHVGLDLGSYFSDLIGPIVATIQDVTEPIKPFLDFLTEPIPVISDLAGPTSLLDIAAISGLVNPGIITAIEVIDQVVDIANSLEGVSGNVIMYFDDFLPSLVIYEAPDAGLLAAGSGIDLSDPSLDLASLKDQLLAGLDFLPEEIQAALGTVAGALQDSVTKMLPGGSASGGFSLPIIEDPSQIFGMLLGQPADLVKFDMAALEVEAEFSAFFSLLGPLGVSINAEFGAQFGPFTFAYDTFGITQFAASDFRNPLLLFDGFYVGDLDAEGNDVPELQFNVGLWAAAELNLAVARGGVGGGLFADIDFDLHDPDDDGRVRIKEMVANVLNEARYFNPALAPLALFDITGKLTAELFAFVKVDLLLFQIDERWHITDPITLLDFESNFTRVPTLATELGDGVLQLNMGTFAEQRVEGDLTDGDEHFIVKQGDDASHVNVWSTLVDFDHDGYDDSEAQEYEATSLILALGGDGNDIIDLSGVTANVKFDLEGNAGDDVITAGSGTGAARILGGAGNDTLTGGGGDDTIFGETGDDIIDGGGGKDWLFGDGDVEDSIVGNVITVGIKASDGVDTITGGDGDDLIFGAGGGDTLEGGNNDDVLIGEGGKVIVDLATRAVISVEDTNKGATGFTDTLRGQAGKDRIYGGLGNDIIEGGADADIIFGEGGLDNISGGDENPVDADPANRGDLIYGGTENDTINAGAGNDTVYGEAGNDTINGGADDDWLYGGTGVDTIHGNAGNDHLFGNSDPDKLYGDAGGDYLEGGQGADLVLGGTGSDLLVAGYGSDTLDGEQDSDTYRITARGGSVTELSTAYDSGSGDTDILMLVGTPEADTILLRAMADFYFPTLVKLIGNVGSDGLTDRILASGEPDKLRAILQALEDAYGPHAIPDGLVSDLIDLFVAEVKSGVVAAITAEYGPDPSPDPDVPALADLIDLLDDPDDPNDPEDYVGILNTESRSKLAEIQKAITDAYGDKPVPATMFDAITNAWNDFTGNFKTTVENTIQSKYKTELEVLGSVTDTGFVALINNGGANVERFNYRDLEGLVVNTLAGDDYVVSDDVIAATTINLGLGEDRVQVGQVFRSERVKDPEGELITGITAEDVYTTLEITRGWLSNGISRPTTINGGDDNDEFTVFHNVAVLNLNGGDGDDLFTVRAFALKGSTDSERARTDMKGDGGADTILYVVNAPVGIDGGDGFDTVRIVGTEFADDFVVTDAGIFGAGLNVSYVNIEKLVADGAEGDDRFFVQSTGLEVVTEIDGGLGSDSFFVGGNPSGAPVPVISNDFKGHSGIILHGVESGDEAWNGVPVEGISANIGDNEEDFVIVHETSGTTRVVEGAAAGSGEGWEFDGYGIRLTRQPGPGQVVTITVVPAGIAPEDEAKGFKDLEFYAPSTSFDGPLGAALGFNALTGAAIAPELIFTAANWAQVQYVRFRAAEDTASEGRRFVFVNHTLQNSTDPDYQSAQMLSVKVQMEDGDRDGVIITPTGRGNTVLENGPADPGFTDTFDVVLAKAPTDDVTVTMSVLNGQVTLSQTTLTFTTLDWFTRRTVTITAPNDDVLEGFHTEYISFTVTSADADETLSNPDPELLGDPGYNDGFINVDGDFDLFGVQDIPIDKPTSYVLLPHRPIVGDPVNNPITIQVGGETLAAGRFSVSGNTLTFLAENGTPEFRTGAVLAKYSYKERGYDGSFVKDSVVDIYDEDAPTVIIEAIDDGSIDVIEGSADTDQYRVRLSRAPAAGEEVEVHVDAVKTRSTYGRTAEFEVQVNVTSLGDADGDPTLTTLIFTSADWNAWQTVTVSAIDDDFFDGNDTQVFAPDLQTVNKIRGPLIIEGAAGAGSLSLPRPVMLPHELNILQPDGVVQSFVAGSGGGAIETMTVRLEDLEDVIDRLQLEDSTITSIQDLVGKTLEMSKGPGTGVVLDPLRPDDLFDRFWLIDTVVDLGDGTVELTLQNPTLVDPSQPNVTAPVGPSADPNAVVSEYAITSLSVNFFADEREQVDYLFVFDEDSVANDKGALTSADGAVQSFTAGAGETETMVVETAALQAVAKLDDLTDVELLEGRRLEISVGPGLGRAWTITQVAEGPTAGTKLLALTKLAGGSGDPTDRSEFRIEGGDTRGRITGFGMGPNILFAGRPQPGGISYGDIEVVQMSLGSGDDEVRVDYATNAEDHTTKRSGDFYTLTLLDTGEGDDVVAVNLHDGDDGAFSLNLNGGDDTVDASASTLPLVIFGWDGEDDITGGTGDDILFGDRGRVDYVTTVEVDTDSDGEPDTLVDQIITRLGHSVAPNPVNPPVTGATATSVSDASTTFETAYGGLVGLSVQAISPEGHVQFRTIVDNDEHTITVDRPWDAIPTTSYFYRVSALPEDQTDGVLRGPRVVWSIDDEIGADDVIHAGGGVDIVIGGAADDTIDSGGAADWVVGDDARFDFEPVEGNDGPTRLVSIIDPGTVGDDVLLGGDDADLLIGGLGNDTIDGQGNDDVLIGDDATVLFAEDGVTIVRIETTNRTQGGSDIVYGGADDDIVIGGTGDDALDGGSADDLIFGDNVTLVLNEGSGDAITPRFRALSGATIYDANGLPQVGATPQGVPGGLPAWADWTITLDQTLEASHFGNDYIAGGGDDDEIFGQLGDDAIQGDGSIDFRRDGQLVGAHRPVDGALTVVASFEGATDGDDYIEGNGGSDTIFGNLGQDDILGGSSTLFSLTTPDRRPDGSDLIFGGSGERIGRSEDLADGVDSFFAERHGRDADAIVGDNGNIFRLVDPAATGGVAYLTFNYDLEGAAADGYSAARRIIPRAVQLVDYTPGGPDFTPAVEENPSDIAINPVTGVRDIGAADEVHGESGDDFIYGMVGSDRLFGDAHDDDIIGGYGYDWISGGAGDDGILGDDGRIFTSRNSEEYDEPLYGIEAVPVDVVIDTPGNIHVSTINVDGQLKKTVDLTPFNLDWNADAQDPLFEPAYANDIIYGGLGNDAMHGGAGDDAMSGAEALPGVFDLAQPQENVLKFGVPRGGEFAAYNQYDPAHKVFVNPDGTFNDAGGGTEFLLNFLAGDGPPTATGKHTDGDDVIFGDLGNDWIVGGTGRDHLWGGRGDDLMNADDDHETNGGLNDQPEPDSTYEDIAYGGGGRDVLIGNTGGDRLIDWAGEFNSYIVPFAPFGEFAVTRMIMPDLMEYLYDLSASDGADPTRADDTGSDPARNGEPHGEIGLVNQKDFDWQDQTGAPDDPQPGNIPGGRRDVLRSADFNQGNMSAFAPDSGTWASANGVLQVSADSPSGDAAAVFFVNAALPRYYEIQASINAGKPTGLWKSNAYVIFDYHSPTDFKFAGVNVSTDKMEMGHRTASGWIVDRQANIQAKPDRFYNMLLAINGTNVTLVVDNQTFFTHTFAPRVIDGVSYGLNQGMVGVGSQNSRGLFDNVAVRVLPPNYTLQETETFDDGAAQRFTGPVTGTWQVVSGRFDGAPVAGAARATNAVDLGLTSGLNTNSILELSTTFSTQGMGGVIFDQYGPDDFKFVALNAETDQVIVGHRTARRGFVVDAVTSRSLAPGVDYTLDVTLKGTTVSVSLDGAVILGYAFNATVVDGDFGLLTSGAATSFDTFMLKTDDEAFLAPAASLVASAAPDALVAGGTVSEADMAPILAEAIRRWGVDLSGSVSVAIVDLPGLALGLTEGSVITVDIDGGGWGWFIDASPDDDREFMRPGADGQLATPGSGAYGRIDFLSVVMHELGHVLAFDHAETGLMGDTLGAGVRRTVDAGDSGTAHARGGQPGQANGQGANGKALGHAVADAAHGAHGEVDGREFGQTVAEVAQQIDDFVEIPDEVFAPPMTATAAPPARAVGAGAPEAGSSAETRNGSLIDWDAELGDLEASSSSPLALGGASRLIPQFTLPSAKDEQPEDAEALVSVLTDWAIELEPVIDGTQPRRRPL